MQKTKILTSIVLTTFLATWAVLAWVDLWTVSDSDTLTATLWNTVMWKINENGNKLSWVYNVWGNIGIWTVNPTESLEIDGSIKINWSWESVTISVDTWNEILKNINKTWYVFSTHNPIDLRHSWNWPGTNFRNCEVIEYFQLWETIQNTVVTSILSYRLWSDRTTRTSSSEHAKFLRDFALHPSYTDPNTSNYASWVTTKYWPSILERCAID